MPKQRELEKKSPYVLWIYRLGKQRVNEEIGIAIREKVPELRALSLHDKASRLYARYRDDDKALNQLVEGGFSDSYHQTIYISREVEIEWEDSRTGLEHFSGGPNVRMGIFSGTNERAKSLFFVAYHLAYFRASDYGRVEAWVEVPVLVNLYRQQHSESRALVAIRILKMQLRDWEPVVGEAVYKLDRRVSHGRIRDAALQSLEDSGAIEQLDPVDFSEKAQEVMKHPNINTNSGYNPRVIGGIPVAEVGGRTIGRRGARPGLREAAPEEFKKLVAPDTLVTRCEVEFLGEGAFGIPTGARFQIAPDMGEISVRARTSEGAIDDFLEFLIS